MRPEIRLISSSFGPRFFPFYERSEYNPATLELADDGSKDVLTEGNSKPDESRWFQEVGDIARAVGF